MSFTRRGFLKFLGIGTAAALAPLPEFKGYQEPGQGGQLAAEFNRHVHPTPMGPSMVPDPNASYDLGSAAHQWNMCYRESSNKFPVDPEPGWLFYHTDYELTVIYDGKEWCSLEGAEGV